MAKSDVQEESKPFRSAFITLIGRPNSGKSTLLNAVIGQEVSIVSALPQTTRATLRGIYTTDSMQIVFIDTPGVHNGKHAFNRSMFNAAKMALFDDVNLICYLVDLSRAWGDEEEVVAGLLRSVTKRPVLVVFNKTDLVASVDDSVASFYRRFPDLEALPSVRLSAAGNDAKERFLAAISPFVPEGPCYFDPDDTTDATMRQIAAEYLRKQIIAHTGREVPHAVFIEIESYRETSERHHIVATIHVETRGQRGIIVGSKGTLIDRIRKEARNELAKLTGIPASITCHVKVSPHWRDDEAFLRHRGVECG